jgi:hypothetical protein
MMRVNLQQQQQQQQQALQQTQQLATSTCTLSSLHM